MIPGLSALPALLAALVAVMGAVTAVSLWLWLRQRRRGERLAAELEHARERERAAVEARETFFDLATHELRSPISAILGYQELLQDGAYGPLDPGADEPVDRIGRSARHLLHLIDGVVELSRLRSHDLRPDLGPVNLGILLTAVADAFRTHAAERGLEARVRLPSSLPTIRSDQDRLVAALDLLVTSAIKHPADGAMGLEVVARDDGADLILEGAYIDIRPEGDDPALRLGIRLAVAMGVAELLGGQLRMEPGDGTPVRRLVFTIRDVAEPTPR